jgi:prepilin-type N-terminal cleavage/methylation domain-containing protein
MYSYRHEANGAGSRRHAAAIRHPANAGMTMIELMVALSLASIVLLGVYAIYSSSSTTYRIQDETMAAMDQARFGLEQLKRDISRAGFLATPNSDADPLVCPKPANPLRGIQFGRAGDVPWFGAADNQNNLNPNEVILFGSFWSSDIYLTRSVIGNLVTLQTAADGAPYPATEAEFNDIFTASRYLRLMNAEQNEGYYLIQSADFATGEIQLVNNVQTATPPGFCGIQGFGVGLSANVAGFVRYRLVIDANDTTGPAGTKVDLVRHEMSPLDASLQTVVDGSGVVVSEYVADLQFYDFVVDTDQFARAPSLLPLAHIGDVLDGGAHLLDNSAGARPQDLRFVTVKLTTRTEHEDENQPHVRRAGNFAPIRTYEVDPEMEGSARTVTLASRVQLKSFTVRNVK